MSEFPDARAVQVGLYNLQVNTFYPDATRAVVETLSAEDVSLAGVFVGRAGDIDRLIDGWRTPLTAVAGPPGVGKTALARHVAAQAIAQGRFPGGAFLVDMRGYAEGQEQVMPGHVVGPFLRAVGMAESEIAPAVDEQAAQYHRLLARREATLLIFDNVGRTGQLTGLLPTATRHRVLVTSRDLLGDLPGVRLLPLGSLPPAEAIELLDLALRRRNPADSRVRQQAEDAAEIARLCGYLPLALSIVAWVLADNPGRPLAVTVRLLSDPAQRLDRLGYGEEVRRAYDLSWRHLSERRPVAAGLLAVLSVHPGADFSIADAAVLAERTPDDTIGELDQLHGATLLELGRRWDRYRFHDLVKIYAAERCAPTDRVTAIERLIDAYHETSEEASKLLDIGTATSDRFAGRDAAMDWFDDEVPNLLAVVRLAHSTGHHRQVCALSWNFDFYADLTRRYDDMVTATGFALESVQRLDPPEGEAELLNSAGIALREVGRVPEAIEKHERSLALFAERRDRRGEGVARGSLAQAYEAAGRTAEAAQQRRRSLEISREVGEPVDEAMSIANEGDVAARIGRFEEALDLYRRALKLKREAGHTDGQINTLASIGRTLSRLNRYAEADSTLQEAAALAKQQRALHRLADALSSLADNSERQNRYDEAVARFGEELAIRRRLDDVAGAGFALQGMASARHSQGRLPEARDLFRQSAVDLSHAGEHSGHGLTCLLLGDVLHDLGDVAAARDAVENGIASFETAGDETNIELARQLLRAL